MSNGTNVKRLRRVRVYRRSSVWYGDCSECPPIEWRARSAWLPYTHRMATEHVQTHRLLEGAR